MRQFVFFLLLSLVPVLTSDAALLRMKIYETDGSCKFKYKLTTDSDFLKSVGKARDVREQKDGGIHVKLLRYPDGLVRFTRFSQSEQPYVLHDIILVGRKEPVDIGQKRTIVLTSLKQLPLFENFAGLQGVDLSNLDLREIPKRFLKLDFDNKTIWPAADKLPEGFNPKEILAKAKDPGLGLSALHNEGITGKGIRIAVIDQPPLLNHEDYCHAFEFFDNTLVPDVGPQMHGAALASISVGKSCGVAPKAKLHYYSVPMWESKNSFYIDCLDAIVAKNKILPKQQGIRAVAISTAMFPLYPRYEEYKKAFARAWKSGIAVFTCQRLKSHQFSFCMLNLATGENADDYKSYRPVSWCPKKLLNKFSLWLPGGTRTVAGPNEKDEYDYSIDCGNSWGPPFLAGLTALAMQVNPKLSPDEIISLLVKTASKADFGKVVNPRAFIKAAKELK